MAYLVDCLTDVSKPSDGNRAVRKEIDRQHLAKASPKAKTIKLADLIDKLPRHLQAQQALCRGFTCKKW